MNNKNNIPIKVKESGYDFLYDLSSNLRLVRKEKKLKRMEISKSKALDLIVKYFKMNPEKYQELIKLYITENEK